ncbi:MAG: DUF4830 domain-containing protein [Acutalibacteraceae bacterium]
MFVVTLKSKKIKRLIFIVLAFLFVVFSVICGFNILCNKTSEACSVSNTADVAEFVSSFGWAVESEPVEVKTVVIPDKFDDVYNNYNKIQLEQGYDLSEYCGKEVERYTFKVVNYPGFENDGTIRANVLVYEGVVIGGDVCSVRLDGFMHGFEAVKK